MRRLTALFSFCLSFIALAPAIANYDNSPTVGPARGWLVIDGGGLPSELKSLFIALAGGRDANFVVIPTADPDQQMEKLAEDVCRSTWAKDSPERMRMHNALEKIRPGIPSGYRITYITINPAKTTAFQFTAWTHVQPDHSVTCIPTDYINWESDGELEFTLAHETGHAVDKACYGHDRQTQQQMCEDRADRIGFGILARAGLNPEIAVSLFQKKHQPNRIKNFREWQKQYAQQRRNNASN